MISHRFAEGAVISVGPDDPLNVAYARMRLYDVSQLPVLDGSKIVGILDESDLLLAVMADAGAFRQPVREFMTTKLQTVPPAARVEGACCRFSTPGTWPSWPTATASTA